MIRLQKFVPSARFCVEVIARSRGAPVQMQISFHDVQTLHRRHSRRDAAVAPGASVGFHSLKSVLRWTASLSQRRAARNTAAKRGHAYVPKILSFIFQRNFRLQLVGQEALVVGTEATEVPPGYERRNGIQFADLLMITTPEREMHNGLRGGN
jgi:hypothetical protein